MLMLGPENATRCTWIDVINHDCLVPHQLAGIPGLLPAELQHYLWDLSDLAATAAGSLGAAASGLGGSLSLLEDLLGSVGGASGGGLKSHGLKVGLLAPPGHASLAAAAEAAGKLPHVIRLNMAAADAPVVNVSLPSVEAWLMLPTMAEAKLRELLQGTAGARESGAGAGGAAPPPTWVVGGDMIAAGPDVLLLEGPLDVSLDAVGSDLFEKTLKERQCHAIRDARLC